MAITGIANMGSTCYMATVMQCIYAVRGLDVFKGKNILEEVPWIRALVSGEAPCMRTFMATFPARHLELRVQNDAHEFMMVLMDELQEAAAKACPHLERVAGNPRQRFETHVNNTWAKLNTSAFTQSFYGLLVSQVQCSGCANITHRFEAFNHILVPVATTLGDAVGAFFKSTVIDGFKCDKCKGCYNSRQVQKVWRLPDVLIITLKRFNHNGSKNTSSVDFPMVLDMGEFSIHDPRSRYALKAAACHVGSTMGGHYYAHVHEETSGWHIVDDDHVIREDRVMQEKHNAYIMFYVRGSG